MIANSKTLDTLRQHPIATVLAIYVVLAVVTTARQLVECVDD